MSGQYRFYDLTANVRQAIVPTLELECQSFVIDPQAVQHRGVEIVDMDWVGHDVIAVVVGFSV